MYEFGEPERQAAVRVMESGWLFRYQPEAPEADSFEVELAGWLATEHALLTSSGTAALICGLSALGIGPGDEVLVPAYGFIADVLAVLAVGAVPVICEVDESLTLDPDEITRKLTPRTRAVLPVHMHGLASDLDRITEHAAKHDLRVIEDACQGLGGTYRGRALGTIGDVGAFSFNQAKIITAGEGGALVTRDAELRERAMLTHDGSAMYGGGEFAEAFAGLAFRASEITAAIARVQLTRLDGIVQRLRALRDRLWTAFDSVSGLRHIPVHDQAGSCGSHVAYLFDDAATAEKLVEVVNRVGSRPFLGTSTGMYAFQATGAGHAFPDWQLVHQGRGGHHPRRNPLAESAWSQGLESCPRSTGIFGRVALVGYGLDLDDATIERVCSALSKELA